MKQNDHSEILVVGAGPVGMYTGLRLAQSGLGVQIIDQASRTAGRSYACALHPRTLQLLDEVDVAQDAIALGHRIDTVAFYEGALRRAELKLSLLPVKFPFMVVLQQSALEDLLEQKLKQRTGLKIQWNHRLADLAIRDGRVEAGIEVLAMTGKGYIVPDFDLEVKKTLSAYASYVVGADGQNSVVRQRLGIAAERTSEPERFTIFEIETEANLSPEMRIVLHEQTTSVLWPFAENKCRWSFQRLAEEAPDDIPQKDRNRFIIAGSSSDADTRQQLQQLLSARAPWFQTNIKNVGWAADIHFQHRLAQRFGQSRAWLAGDAAHQTGPVGMQSMNMGFREGADLAARLKSILREQASPSLLETYNREGWTAWAQLLGLSGEPKASTAANAWVRERWGRTSQCIPASGSELSALLRQLGLEFDFAGQPEVPVKI